MTFAGSRTQNPPWATTCGVHIQVSSPFCSAGQARCAAHQENRAAQMSLTLTLSRQTGEGIRRTAWNLDPHPTLNDSRRSRPVRAVPRAHGKERSGILSLRLRSGLRLVEAELSRSAPE